MPHPLYIIGGIVFANIAGLLMAVGLAAFMFNIETVKVCSGLVLLGLLANIGAVYLLSR